jgi:HK97 family phage prohead protease
MAETYRPNKSMQEEAKRALAWIADGKAGSGFTDVGRKRASDIAAGNSMSAEIVLRMYSFFARHEVDKKGQGFSPDEDGYPSAGRVAWAAWGGDAGYSWSTKIRDQISTSARALSLMTSKEDAMALNEGTPELSEELTELLADVVTFYLRAHGAHWNVVGTDFAEYHALFAAIYDDVYDSIDPLAENIRKIGVQAPFQMSQFMELRTISDGELSTDARVLALDLLTANEMVIRGIADAFNCATEYNEQGIANFLADRLDKHQMWRWQLSSSLGMEVTPSDLTAESPEEVAEEGMYMETKGAEKELVEARKSMATAERITMQAEVRAMDTTDGSLRIGGYAATFNKEATGLNFREVIAPGAFKRTLSTDNPVFLLINHDMESLPLASTRSGTLTLSEDKVGLRMEAELDPSNPRAQELASALRRGDVDKMSFAFTVAADGDIRSEGLRTLTDLDLYEVSVVTLPAYDSTTVGMRSEQDENEELELRKKKLELSQKQFRLRKK